MNGTEPIEFRMDRERIQNGLIDMAHLLRLEGNRQNKVFFNAAFFAALQQDLGAAMQPALTHFIKIPYRLRCFIGNGIGIDMGMKIDKFQRLSPDFSKDFELSLPCFKKEVNGNLDKSFFFCYTNYTFNMKGTATTKMDSDSSSDSDNRCFTDFNKHICS